MTENLEPIWWARLNRLGERVSALEQKGARPTVLIDLPRTIHEWYDLLQSLQKLLIWLTPRFILPAWGAIQSLWPWLQHVGFPALRQFLGF